MRYLYAIVACIAIFVAYILIGAVLGWKHGGGAIPIVLLLFLFSWTWRTIVGKPEG